MLAAASLGAIWSSCSPDFGVRGVLDRFGQIEPSVLIATDGYTYNGKRFETLGRVAEMLPQLPSVQRVVIVPFLDAEPNGARVPKAVLWRGFLGRWTSRRRADLHRSALRSPAVHHVFSGTTGVPKCIVHGHGGTLLQHMKELMLHTDLRAGERSSTSRRAAG
jgi:acetoacetyl-CoA synthetase